MKIIDHRLDDDNVKHLPRTGRIITPEVIVIHYGVTRTIASLVAAQRARGYWAHLSIDGRTSDTGAVYEITQALPFNRRGSHAGESSYKGRSRVNDFSIGIEIANPGPLLESHGKLTDVYHREWTERPVWEGSHKYPRAPKQWQNWAIYTDQEIDICVDVCFSLRRAYPLITDVVGHDEISPGRKFDPGPAFPMEWLRETVFG